MLVSFNFTISSPSFHLLISIAYYCLWVIISYHNMNIYSLFFSFTSSSSFWVLISCYLINLLLPFILYYALPTLTYSIFFISFLFLPSTSNTISSIYSMSSHPFRFRLSFLLSKLTILLGFIML